ncbi:MAG: T9SS type A sorting domain-containing protein [Chitinophagaceae bacterium]
MIGQQKLVSCLLNKVRKAISVLICLLLFSAGSTFAQKEGDNWVSGAGVTYLTTFQKDTAINTIYIDTVILPYYLGMGHGNSCISDSMGNLLFYSNGMRVFRRDYTLMEGGVQLAPDYYFLKQDGWSGYSQSSLILPVGKGIYYLFTPTCSDYRAKIWDSTSSGDDLFFDLFWYHIIDMNANAGMGKVVQSKIPLIENGYLGKPEMMAVRHANGRDWWLLKGRYNKGTDNVIGYHTYLVSANGVTEYGIQYFPRIAQDYDWDLDGQCVFSPDGSMFATVTGHRGTINLFDFDRCSGILSNQRAIHVPRLPVDSVDLEWRTTVGIAFSPNQKYIYVNGYTNIMQYELGESDSSKAWYWVNENNQQGANFSNCYVGPNGKLYMGNWHGVGTTWCVINEPNKKGIACNYGNHSFQFPYFGATTPPCMPNFRLGALAGSACDTLHAVEPPSNLAFMVYPNPASTTITIQYSNASNTIFALYDMAGRALFRTELPATQNKVSIDVRSLASGLYTYKQIHHDASIQTGKLLIQ